MRKHPRAHITWQAGLEAADAISAIEQRHGLTPCELLTILNGIVAENLRSVLQQERHPDDPSKSADVE